MFEGMLQNMNSNKVAKTSVSFAEICFFLFSGTIVKKLSTDFVISFRTSKLIYKKKRVFMLTRVSSA